MLRRGLGFVVAARLTALVAQTAVERRPARLWRAFFDRLRMSGVGSVGLRMSRALVLLLATDRSEIGVVALS